MKMQKHVITGKILMLRRYKVFLISNFLRVFLLLGYSPAYEFYVPTYGKHFHLHRRCKLTAPIKTEQTVFRNVGT
jgi:hypothetical protein